jgi:hypothetical protein
VSSMKKCIFISWEKCFCTVFCEFFEFIFDCTCALADQSRNAGMLQLSVISDISTSGRDRNMNISIVMFGFMGIPAGYSFSR